MPFVVGETIGPYRLIEQLGQGGMATVYKAYHASLDRYVAIKALHPAFMEDPNFLARFQREARVVAKLEHPNIVPIYDYAEYEGRPYLVMKFIEGETLKACLNRSELPPEQIIQIAETVGAALTYAHQQGILHRDVKPSNVMLAKDGQIYLADFGLARIAAAGESTLSSDMVLGTPQYISPEQALGKRDLDAGTDIYSFGVVLYELVVGKVPFSGDTPYAVIHDHIYTPLPMPRMYNPNLPEAVERVLLKALAKDRPDRYAEVTALVAGFRQALGGTPTFTGETRLTPSVEMPTRAAPDAAIPAQREITPMPFPTLESGAAKPAAATPAVQAIPPQKRSRKKWILGCSIPLGVVLCLCLALVLLNGIQKKKIAQQQPTQLPEVSNPTLAVEVGAPPPGEAPKPTLAVEVGAPPPEEAPKPTLAVEVGAPPPEPEQPAEAFYKTNFEGELPGWELQPGWERRDGAVCGKGPAMAVYRDQVFGDFVEVFRLKMNGVLHVSVHGSENPLRRYIVGINQPDQRANLSKQVLERVVNENLVNGVMELPAETWSEVMLTVQGDLLTLRINGQQLWEFRDERPLPAGLIAFEVVEGMACVDDLAILAPPPPGQKP